MKYIFLMLLGVFTAHCSPLYAEDTLSLPDTEVSIRAHDGTELSFAQYPAQGNDLVLWIGEYGWHDHAIQLAKDFAQKGIEVWQIDFAEALMQTTSSNFFRNVDAEYIVDMIAAVHQRSGKRVTLFAQSYAAIPVLRGAELWQQRKTHHGKLLGTVLFSPDLVTGLPALGKDPEYLDITRATSVPIMIYQGGLHGSELQYSRLLKELGSHNPNVFSTVLPGVTSVFYHDESSPETLALLRALPTKISDVFKLFSSLPVLAVSTPYVQPKEISDAKPDIKLGAFASDPVPHKIDLHDANGKRFKLDNYRGKVTVVNFWATWCPPCIEEIPSLNRLREKMQGENFELISINYADTPAKIREFLTKVHVQFPVLIDPNGKTAQQWKVIGFPSTFVIGKDGKIRYGVNAAIEWDTPEVIETLKQLNR
jgi:peroxiredoxin